ncbi:MAG: hypothetical protein ACRYHQ_31135, partial [Janthinobacterium lividum]
MSDMYMSAFCLVSTVNHTNIPNGNTSSFQQIKFDTVSKNVGGAFNLSSNTYTAPTTGFYRITTKLRLDDNAATVSYGLGADSSMVDGPWFIWSQTDIGSTYNRNGLLNTRVVSLNAGDPIVMYGYGFVDYIFAEMCIELVMTASGQETVLMTYAQLCDGVTWPATAHNGEQAFCSNAR